MRAATALIYIVMFITGVTAVSLAANRAALARTALATARSDLAITTNQANELLRLRAAAPANPVAHRPASGLQPRLASALARCALPAATLASLAPEPESSAGPGLRSQHATLVLTPITLPQLGGFLAAWRAAEPDWTVTSIELAQANLSSRDTGNNSNALGGDLPLRAIVQLESVYAAVPAPPLVTESSR
ncbi:MAG: hypothetical protein ACKVW3_08170 [Phycisphaerales bacterium]